MTWTDELHYPVPVRYLAACLLVTLALACGSSTPAEPGSAGDGAAGAAPDGSTAGTADVSGAAVAAMSIRARCALVCQTVAPLQCARSATCAFDCEEGYATVLRMAPRCDPELGALLSCEALRPLMDWECAVDGNPQLKDGVCEVEVSNAGRCYLNGS